MNANCKEATSLEEKILVTKNKLQPAFHLPSSSVKYQEPSFCCEEIPEIKKIAPKDDSSSDSGLNKNQQMIKLSETLSRPLRIEPPSDGPRSEWLPPIPTEQQDESNYSLQSEPVLEPVFLPQQKSFPKWKTGRQSPLPTGTQVRAFQNLRGQSNPRGARSYTMTSSGRDDIQHAFENIQNDYELSFQERRRRCQTRYPRPQIIFRNQPRISWRKRIRRFARDIRRFVQNLFNCRRT
ncbi:hypothetical protein TNCT_339871 [Trichonephila clavata]|uniref:Uncharacterized protein n=1 Tax=Trichonephila clavata TaxID=2740835 RepID=A0A8X6HRR5_TRICU|nr:hypothetical protein TNCT_339871 [Trichonephila clavata]